MFKWMCFRLIDANLLIEGEGHVAFLSLSPMTKAWSLESSPDKLFSIQMFHLLDVSNLFDVFATTKNVLTHI